ncbi:hypothetical protein BN871_AF_00110 [Paenibacillus sp. P22]|nr:hypothetical protein BN871_AF_00110 [Paenibacillus sp. P22]
MRIHQVQRLEQDVQGDQAHEARKHAQHEDDGQHVLAPLETEARDGVAGQQHEQRAEHHRHQRDFERIHVPVREQEALGGEQLPVVVQGEFFRNQRFAVQGFARPEGSENNPYRRVEHAYAGDGQEQVAEGKPEDFAGFAVHWIISSSRNERVLR